MVKITPHLWFDKEAKEATEFYVAAFGEGSKITNSITLHDTPSGDCDVVSFELMDQPFMAMSAGPLFKFNPSISFLVNFDPERDEEARKNLDALWQQLSEGGKTLMELDKYPFSERYGWVQDKYGLSWQLILTNPEGEERPPIIPSMLFTRDKYGKAEEVSDFYLSVFEDSTLNSSGQAKRGIIVKYPADAKPNKEGTVMFTDFKLLDTWFAAMDGGGQHDFDFNEAISFIVKCEDQAEIDYYFEKLSAVPESEQCGWLKDRYGLSWQIVPKEMDKMMSRGTPEQIDRLTQALLPMKKLDLAKLKGAYEEGK